MPVPTETISSKVSVSEMRTRRIAEIPSLPPAERPGR